MHGSADRRRFDPVSLIAGLGIAALGGLLLLDQEGVLELSLGWLGAAVAAIAGSALLISGLRDDGSGSRPPEPSE